MIQGRAADLNVTHRRSGARVGWESGAIMSIAPASGRRTVSGLSLASCDSQAQSLGSCSDPPDSCSVWQQPAASFTCPAFALQQQSGIATRSERKAEKMTLKGFKAIKEFDVYHAVSSPLTNGFTCNKPREDQTLKIYSGAVFFRRIPCMHVPHARVPCKWGVILPIRYEGQCSSQTRHQPCVVSPPTPAGA